MLLYLLVLFSPTYAELRPLAAEEMDSVSGQGGVYLSGEFTINKDGGPLWDNSRNGKNCVGKCGLRFAISVDDSGNEWYVLDDVSGGMSFEGLTMRTEYIDKDEEGGNFDKEVLKVGLPGKVKMNDYKFTFAFSNKGAYGEGGSSFRQTDIFSVRQNGDVTLKGNLLLFPTD